MATLSFPPVLWLDQGMALEGRLQWESSVIYIEYWMPDPVLWLDQGIAVEGRRGRA